MYVIRQVTNVRTYLTLLPCMSWFVPCRFRADAVSADIKPAIFAIENINKHEN
jgi:hypothetical protein